MPVAWADLIDALALAQHVVSFVFLSTCHSVDVGQAFANRLRTAVIACSGSLGDELAIRFSSVFYQQALTGSSLESAAADAGFAARVEFAPAPATFRMFAPERG